MTDMCSDTKEKGIVNVLIEEEMESAYLEYAMSVIVSRAIPDVRDGLKPVHRRILYSMNEIDCAYNKAHKKSARVVGDVMGKYHPHGDVAIYHAMVRMAQDFSMREMLVNGQGNFGSIDADPPASMRYTEARLTKLSSTMMEDLKKNTIDFRENYDGTQKEPSVLPATYPNILVNGTEGIAVGMATNIPPHNLGELIDCCLHYIENPSMTIDDVIKIMPGPDFPTGATVMGRAGYISAVSTGRGSVMMRGITDIEEIKGNRQAIIIKEIPYQVIKTKLIEKIVELIKDKRLVGISDIRDESNKQGIRVYIELKKDAHADVILNHLYKYTQLQTSFSYNMLVLNNMKPELMSVLGIIRRFLEFREEVIVRRITHLLLIARNKAHALIGLCVAVDNIDEVIKIIRSSKDTTEAKKRLASKSWPAGNNIERLISLVHDKNNNVIKGKFYFTQEQLKSILEMKLSKLTGLEKEKLVSELEVIGKDIEKFLYILGNNNEVINIIVNELIKIKEDFGNPRRTKVIIDEAEDSDIEDLIPKEDMLITMTINGFIKRNPLNELSAQKRGGKGKKGMQANEDDIISDVLVSNTHQAILFFSNFGKVYKLKTYQLPLGGPNKKGRAVVNLIPLQNGEKINNIVAISEKPEERENKSLMFATKNGNIRRSDMSDFENINSGGKIAIKLDDNDRLVRVVLASDDMHIMLCSKSGNAVRFPIRILRVIKSRSSNGVRGMRINTGDEVVSMCIIDGVEQEPAIRDEYLLISYSVRAKLQGATSIDVLSKVSRLKKEDGTNRVNLNIISAEQITDMISREQCILTITENGYGKRTSAFAYRVSSRGGKGVISINTSTRNGGVASSFVAENDDDIILITKLGKTIRCKASGISIVSRTSKGVRIFKLGNGDKIVSVARVPSEANEEINEEGEI